MALLARKNLVIGAIGAVVAILLLVQRSRRPVAAELAVVGRGTVRVTLDEQGVTRVRVHADVSAPVSGRWVPGAVSVGAAVAESAALGVMHPAPLDAASTEQARARLGAAEAAAREARAVLAQAAAAWRDAQRQLGRYERLAAAGGISQQDLDRVRTEEAQRAAARDAAEFRVKAVDFDVRSARSVVASIGDGAAGTALTVRAPATGVVLRLAEEHERVLAAGTPLALLGDPRSTEVVIPILSTDAPRVTAGQRVRVWVGGPDTLDAHVTRVEPAAFTRVSALGVEEQRVHVIAQFDRGPTGIGDAFRVEASIITAEAGGAMTVPIAALAAHGSAWDALVVSGGVARRRTVTIGRRGVDVAEVLAGLSMGDTVVVFPGDAVTDGTRVKRRP